VRLLERVDESYVVAAFLGGEIDSPRFRDALLAALAESGVGEDIVRSPDLADEQANALRHLVFERFRGAYVGRWFHELDWSRAELESDEVLAIRYIAWDYWLEITGGTRMPADGASYFRRRGEDDRYLEGGRPLIVVRASASSHLVVVEGHGRLTALAMHPATIPAPLEVLLGEGEAVRSWGCY
jgi:hypothetical protein